MKLARIASTFAFTAAIAFLMSVVPGAPKSASAQGPAARYECNYVTANNTSVASATGNVVAVGTSTNGTTYVTPNVLVSFNGTSSFSGIANRRNLRAQVTTNIISRVTQTDGSDVVITEHIFEFQNASDNDGVCELNEMCFRTTDRGVFTPTATVGSYDIDISMAVSNGGQQLRGLCGKLVNSRNSSSSTGDLGGVPGTPEVPTPTPTNHATEISRITPTTIQFVIQGALCECQTNKSGPLDYGQQNDQGI